MRLKCTNINDKCPNCNCYTLGCHGRSYTYPKNSKYRFITKKYTCKHCKSTFDGSITIDKEYKR